VLRAARARSLRSMEAQRVARVANGLMKAGCFMCCAANVAKMPERVGQVTYFYGEAGMGRGGKKRGSDWERQHLAGRFGLEVWAGGLSRFMSVRVRFVCVFAYLKKCATACAVGKCKYNAIESCHIMHICKFFVRQLPSLQECFNLNNHNTQKPLNKL